MALRVPEVFITNPHQAKRAKQKEHGFVLPEHHRQDLRDVARGVEETNAGVCTKYLIDHSVPAGRDDEGDVDLHVLERWCDRFVIFSNPTVKTWRNRILRAKRTLEKMQARKLQNEVAILHVTHGYTCPVTRALEKKVADYLGDSAPLLKYTDAVEEVRQELVRAELSLVLERSSTTSNVVSILPAVERRAWVDRVISSADALCAALKPYVGARGVPDVDRRGVHEARRASFLVAAKRDADAMLQNAEQSYWQHWLATP